MPPALGAAHSDDRSMAYYRSDILMRTYDEMTRHFAYPECFRFGIRVIYRACCRGIMWRQSICNGAVNDGRQHRRRLAWLKEAVTTKRRRRSTIDERFRGLAAAGFCPKHE
ncbi:hypothetical protein RB195_021287 [Necator americanus]|uniref:Uncharacterized protein n=1 Tax=Necator americanus TaxID=51031 RepID=A0ABR1ECW6_NECAM